MRWRTAHVRFWGKADMTIRIAKLRGRGGESVFGSRTKPLTVAGFRVRALARRRRAWTRLYARAGM